MGGVETHLRKMSFAALKVIRTSTALPKSWHPRNSNLWMRGGPSLAGMSLHERWAALGFAVEKGRVSDNPGVIKLLILGESNNTNLWYFLFGLVIYNEPCNLPSHSLTWFHLIKGGPFE